MHRGRIFRVLVLACLLSVGLIASSAVAALAVSSGGTSWIGQTSGTTSNLYGLDFTDANTGWVVGDGGTILKTTNAGSTWATQASGKSYYLRSVDFADANTGYAVGQTGTILKTTDGGANWTTLAPITSRNLEGVDFKDASTGWAVGANGIILGTADGGANWTTLWGTAYTLNSVCFVDSSTGWAVGDGGTILKTTNAGSTWTAQTSGNTNKLFRVHFLNTSTGWAVGGIGTILKTTDGGATWVAQNSGTTLALNGAYFTDVNTGWVVGTGGTILKTTDGGATWAAQNSGTTTTLNCADFVGSSFGWVSGLGGTILHADTPHTPAVPVRVPGANRYDVAVNLARILKPSLAFTDVIVACGEDRAMADPLGAAALASAYDCPVLLTPSAKANPGTVATIKSIASANGGHVNIHVVGGTSSIPAAVYNAIAQAKGSGTIERINGANRYDLAYQIAARTKAVLESKGRSVPGVIVVNIENPASFNDALAASPISARTHMPLIGVKGAIVPAEAGKALALFPGKPRYALNSAYLTPGVRNATGCGVAVTSSANREVAAVDIAKWGVANGFVSYRNVGLANKLSDALPAGGVIGQLDGVMLYTSASPLSATTAAFVPTIKNQVDSAWVFGGTATITDATAAQFKAALQ